MENHIKGRSFFIVEPAGFGIMSLPLLKDIEDQGTILLELYPFLTCTSTTITAQKIVCLLTKKELFDTVSRTKTQVKKMLELITDLTNQSFMCSTSRSVEGLAHPISIV